MTTNETEARPIIHTVGATGRFIVQVASWDVELIGVDGDEVRVRDAAGGPLPSDIEVERGDGSFRIAQPSSLRGLGVEIVIGGPRDVRLAIEVPRGAQIDARSASGDIASSGLRADQHIRTASGDVAVHGTAGDLAVETVSGDIAVGIEGSLRLTGRSVSGDVTVEGGIVDRLRLTTTSGDLRVSSELGPGPHAIQTLSGDALLSADRGVRVTAQTISGDIRSDLPHSSGGRPGRRSIVIGDGTIEVQFKSVSGDLRVVGGGARSTMIESREPVEPPERPEAPERPDAPEPPAPRSRDATSPDTLHPDTLDDPETARLAILRELERGEIDIAEATDRLARLDEAGDV